MNSPIKYWRSTKNWPNYLGKTGRIITATQIHSGPEGFEKQSPYWAGIIKLQDGKQVTGQIINIKNHKKVMGVLRKVREVGNEQVIEYGIKWKGI